jgi:hypothetical protein
MKHTRLIGLALASVMALSLPLGMAAAAPASKLPTATVAQATSATNSFDNLPVTGTTATGGTFRGLLDIVRFRLVDGNLVAVGDLTGTLRNASGGLVGTVVDQRVRLPVKIGAASTCDILHLKLGPLDLNLLGLVVHLDRIVLDITADAGPGNLLGNLLCAIAGLLDQGLNLNGVLRDLLNAVIGVINL